jgi:hypothetical protein
VVLRSGRKGDPARVGGQMSPLSARMSARRLDGALPAPEHAHPSLQARYRSGLSAPRLLRRRLLRRQGRCLHSAFFEVELEAHQRFPA